MAFVKEFCGSGIPWDVKGIPLYSSDRKNKVWDWMVPERSN